MSGKQKPDIPIYDVEESQKRLCFVIDNLWNKFEQQISEKFINAINTKQNTTSGIELALQKITYLVAHKDIHQNMIEDPGLEQTRIEVREILRHILICKNIEYLKTYQSGFEGASYFLPSEIVTLMAQFINPSIFQYNLDMDLLVYACGIFSATGYEYELYRQNEDGNKERVDNILGHILSGVKTAQTMLINAESFLRKKGILEQNIKVILKNSYSCFFVPLMRMPLNSFVMSQEFFLREEHDWVFFVDLTRDISGKSTLSLNISNIEKVLTTILAELDDDELDQQYYEIIVSNLSIGCPALYSRTLLEVFNAALG